MRLYTPLAMLLLFTGCRSAGQRAVVTGVARAPDGVSIAYDVRGAGETALVFVHGWACDRSFWHEQLDAFSNDYRVVSLDLGGHGWSGAERETWSVAGLAGDVRTVVEGLGLERVILIGHSLGGPVSLLAARRMPGRVVGVVGVDTLHDAELAPPEGMAEQMARQFEADFEGTMAAAVRSMFPEEADPALVEWVISKASAVNQEAILAILRDAPNFDLKESLSAVNVPVRCVNATPRTQGGFKTAVETNRAYADFDAVVMEGVGHFLMLERPEEFNARLREILAELTSR
jgi:pimeloyl-ACP methyl ester carboxylesterase